MSGIDTRSSRISERSRTLIWYGIAAIIIGMPFHAFLITWISAHTPSIIALPLRYWKELILVAITLATGVILAREPALRRKFLSDKMVWLVAIFAVIHLIILGIYGATAFAAILGLKINLGFLLLYLIAATTLDSIKVSLDTLVNLILVPAGIVGLFGVLQLTILPRNILEYFGYGAPGEPNPAYYLIENSHTLRIMSTLWAPNQFGSYLVLPLILSVWWAFRSTGKQRIFAICVFLVDTISLYGSQSRGAWLAAVIAITALIIYTLRGWYRFAIAGVIVAGLFALSILASANRLPARLELLINHGIPTAGQTGYLSSNGGHIRAVTLGYDKLKAKPLGGGLEAAGRASEGTSGQLYTENFYLQLAVQTGYEGLVVFLIIIGITAWRLRPQIATHPLTIPLLAVLIGLSANNLVAHTWSDGATAWLWWPLAGLVYTQSRHSSKEIA